MEVLISLILVQTFVATHTVLKRKFVLKMVNQGAKDEKDNYNYLIKEGKMSLTKHKFSKRWSILTSTNVINSSEAKITSTSFLITLKDRLYKT